MEPGRSLVAPSGITVYKVGTVKRIKDIRNYVCVDGGMGDNPRFIMYGARHGALLVENPLGEKEETVTIAGKCCESGDVLVENIELPKAKKGDYLAVLTTGAYNYSMASNYNRVLKPAAVLVNNSQSDIIIERESYEHLVSLDVIPQRFNK